jgi:hypothetical protein
MLTNIFYRSRKDSSPETSPRDILDHFERLLRRAVFSVLPVEKTNQSYLHAGATFSNAWQQTHILFFT